MLILPLWLIIFYPLSAQFSGEGEIEFGNEWIDPEQAYAKIQLAKDGFYKLSYQQLKAAGIPVETLSPNQLQINLLGKPIAFYSSSNNNFQEGDYILFYGQQNRAEADRYLYQNPEEELFNPYYSLITDTSTYFISWTQQANSTNLYSQLSNDLTNLPAKESWHWAEERIVFTEEAMYKKYDPQDLIAYSIFDEGEGFGTPFLKQHIVDFRIDPFPASVESRLELNLFPRKIEHILSIKVNDNEILNKELPAVYNLEQLNLSIPADDLRNNMKFTIEGTKANSDRYSLSFVQLTYPKAFELDQSSSYTFNLPPGPRRYFEVSDFDLEGNEILIFNQTEKYMIEGAIEDGVLKFSLPSNNDTVVISILNTTTGIEDFSKTINRAAKLKDFSSSAANYLILSHSNLFEDESGTNWVQNYADYRSSAEGGEHVVEIIDVADLFDVFGFGIKNHPLALYNFGQLAEKQWPNLQYVLILGHGYNYADSRNGTAGNSQQQLIPTYGYPGSDNIFFSPPGKSGAYFAHGRLAVNTPEEIKNYLDKVKKHERSFEESQDLLNQNWRKKVLHIVGGGKASEQRSFKFFMDKMANTISNNGFGGKVTTVQKASNDPVQTSTSEAVISSVNDGVAIKAYLGHGGVTSTDFGLDNPLLFDNTERYPLIFSLGCLTGNLFDQQISLSENFILTPNRGGIAYIASGGFAYPNNLEDFTSRFYELIGDDQYTDGVGDIIKTIRQENNDSRIVGVFSLMEQLTYHGDPAIKLRRIKGPDYLIDFESFKIQPEIITTQQDSFQVSFDIVNIGFNQTDSFPIIIERTFPNGEIERFRDTILTLIDETPLSYSFAIGPESAAGENKVNIILDPNNQVRELPAGSAEANNQLTSSDGRNGINFYVQKSEINVISPFNFGIVNRKPEFIAVISSLNAQDISIEFELDTTPSFNSPFRKFLQLSVTNNLMEWQVEDLELMDEQVFYWRVREVGNNNETFQGWQNYSFVYLEKAENTDKGWNQSDYFQFAQNSLTQVIPQEQSRSFEFGNRFVDVTGESRAYNGANDSRSRYLYENIRRYQAPNNWPRNLGVSSRHIAVAAFNPNTGAIMMANPNSQGNYGAVTRASALPTFIFKIDEAADRDSVVNFIENGIPDGYYTLFLTFHTPPETLGAENWAMDSLSFGRNIFQALERQGAVNARSLANNSNLPYAFAFIKNQEPLGEMLAPSFNEVAVVNFAMPSKERKGAINSTLIGPASSWGTLNWEKAAFSNEQESAKLNLMGWNAQRTQSDTLFASITQAQLDLENIATDAYPFLQLTYQTEDSVDFTFTKLNKWRMLYEPLAELIPLVSLQEGISSDTLSEGQKLVRNITIRNFNRDIQDSITVQMTIRAANNETTTLFKRIPPIPIDSSYQFDFEFETTSLQGKYNLIVEVNPDQSIKEIDYTNNISISDFVIASDRLPPLLEVTFDGRHILNRELVSAQPIINIALRDENQFLRLQDTSLFNIWVEFPDGSERAFKMSDPEVLFFAAEDTDRNVAKVELQPQFAQKGIHKLIIRATDVSGNLGGSAFFERSFEVIPESQISEILPYPNPFTTSCRFVYTLTGDRSPEDFKIQIFSVSGRIVKEITKEEFGPMRVGTHLSEYVWDGTDDFGDQLAKGVYLYKVYARDEDQKQLDRYSTSADRFFEQGFGKIVILK